MRAEAEVIRNSISAGQGASIWHREGTCASMSASHQVSICIHGGEGEAGTWQQQRLCPILRACVLPARSARWEHLVV